MLCWIEEVKVGIVVLFQVFMGRLLAFHHWVLYWLWVCHKWSLLCWDTASLFPLWLAFCHEWMLIFVKCFSCAIWSEPSIWFLCFMVNTFLKAGRGIGTRRMGDRRQGDFLLCIFFSFFGFLHVFFIQKRNSLLGNYGNINPLWSPPSWTHLSLQFSSGGCVLIVVQTPEPFHLAKLKLYTH